MNSMTILKATGSLSIKIRSSVICNWWRPENMASNALPLMAVKVDFLTSMSLWPPTFSFTILSIGYIYAIQVFSFYHSSISFFILSESATILSYSSLKLDFLFSNSIFKSLIFSTYFFWSDIKYFSSIFYLWILETKSFFWAFNLFLFTIPFFLILPH